MEEYSSIKRVLFTSSGVAYGSASDYEESTLPTIDPFDLSMSLAFGKLTSEYILSASAAQGTSKLCIARCFSFVSPSLPVDIHYAIGNFARKAITNEDIIISSDGSDLRSYQHVSDTVDWLTELMIRPNVPRLINIGSDRSISILQLARLVVDVLHSKSNIVVLNQSTAADNFRRRSYVPSLVQASALGLTNKISLEQAVLELGNHLRTSL